MAVDPYCLACGGPVEVPLAQLGSLRCQDCRGEQRSLDRAFVSPPKPTRLGLLFGRSKRSGPAGSPRPPSDDLR